MTNPSSVGFCRSPLHSVSTLACPPAQVGKGAPCWPLSFPKHLCRQQSRRSVSPSAVGLVGRVMDGFVEENCRWHPRTTAPRLAARFSAFASLVEGGECVAGPRGRLTVSHWLATLRERGRTRSESLLLATDRPFCPAISRSSGGRKCEALSLSLSLARARARSYCQSTFVCSPCLNKSPNYCCVACGSRDRRA